MNYEEYKKSDGEQRELTVTFNPKDNPEFKRGHTTTFGGNCDTTWILHDEEAGWYFEYVERNMTGRLHTVDVDGNLKKRSCFQLDVKYVGKYMEEYYHNMKFKMAQRVNTIVTVEAFRTEEECIEFLKNNGCKIVEDIEKSFKDKACYNYNGVLVLYDPYELITDKA